jgi:plastocyanin
VSARRLAAAAALAASLAVLVAAGVAGGAPARARYFKTVLVRDNFYSPARMTVKPYTRVTWRWSSESGDTHDVKLVSGPRGVPHFQSEAAAVGYRYPRLLVKPGTYRLICTFHEVEMRQVIVVKG